MNDAPIFIHGIAQRSGTNFLNKVVLLHPDCFQPQTDVREDWFLAEIDLLDPFVQRLEKKWSNPLWQGTPYERTKLYQSIGKAMLEFLRTGCTEPEKRLITKTPSVTNLHRFIEVFPNGKLLLIVRDGRDVAASARKTWDRPLKRSAKQWAAAADTISEFQKSNPADSYLLLKYESLHENLRDQIEVLLKFLGLDPDKYDWDGLDSLPVSGSSTSKNWENQKKDENFNPVGRWESWTSREKKMFHRIAREQLQRFGYAVD